MLTFYQKNYGFLISTYLRIWLFISFDFIMSHNFDITVFIFYQNFDFLTKNVIFSCINY